MMTEEQELKLQALLDGELSGADRSAAEQWLENTPAARALYSELEMVRTAVRHNEVERTLNCGREFYWNAIERAITAEPATEPVGTVSILGWLRANFVAVSAAAALVVAAFVGLSPERPIPPQAMDAEAEMVWETAHADTGWITFQNHETGFSLVWLVDRTKQDPADLQQASVSTP